jgi:hypothetical protein
MTAATRHLEDADSSGCAASFAARALARLAGEEGSPAWLAKQQYEESFQCSLLRDVIGSPFEPFRFDPAWLSGDGERAAALARRIDAEDRFDELPSLADVLAQAGCRDDTVLDHCRALGPHVRGCWVVDALLGREDAVREGLTTEADWQMCDDPTPLLHFLHDKGIDRQWRLFAVACCRRIDDWITDERSRRAVEVAARYAEGEATEEELDEARAEAQAARDEAKSAEWSAEAEEGFCLTPRYAAVSRDLFAAEAARGAVCRDPRSSDHAPGTYEAGRWRPSHEWATAAVRWHYYAILNDDVEDPDDGPDEPTAASLRLTEHGKLGSGPRRASVEAAAEAARVAELCALCEILRDLFGEFLGPPGAEGVWLPFEGGRLEAWCLLPSPAGGPDAHRASGSRSDERP